ncbi:Transferase [Sesbania bispinosa]|nr:Transferase [Sesbania bispinosa]
MTQTAPFNVVQVCSVAPLQGTPTSLPLTFFDLLWLRFPPVERLFFYEYQNSTSSFFDSVLPNLKHSLSQTLQHFLPLAGNFTWPHDSAKPIIQYVPGDAVSFTVAESNASFTHLCSDLCEAAQRYPLIPHLTTSHEQASVIALQVTLFPNSGFCIGITTHHAAFDGKSSTSFMKSWAYACSKLEESPSSSSLPEKLTPFFDRSVIRDPAGIGELYSEAWLKHGGPNNRSLKVWDSLNALQTDAMKGLFELTPSHIQKLKQYAHSMLKKKDHISTFSVTCAYVLACLIKAQQPKCNRLVFIFSVDCRSRLDPPTQPTYFGNCVAGQKIVAETKKLLEKDGFISALEGINEALNRVKDGVLNGIETWISTILNVPEDKIYSTAGSPRFEVYSIDFGWGKPKKVDVTSIDKTGAFSLSENRNNDGGIEIGLALNKPEMEAFSAVFVQGLESF